MSSFVGVDASLETDHECPRCGYAWKGDCEGAGRLPGQGNLFSEEHAPELPLLATETAPLATGEVPAGDPIHPQEAAREGREVLGVGRMSGGSSSDPGQGASGLDEPSSTVVADGGRERQGLVVTQVPDVEQTSLPIHEAKPPYRIPSMAEIRAVPGTGLTVVSTFSGCGGSCLGFKWAGFQALWASEFVPAAADTYRANFPDVPLGIQDVREVEPELILASLGLARGELDVLEGSPPCASFSTAGKRDAHWGEVKKYSDVRQRTDDLLMEYVRLLRGLAPRAFVMENVPGLVTGVARGYFLELFRAFEESGYKVAAKLLDAQWLGVPQRRRRVIFVGFRRDLGRHPLHDAFPEPLTYRYSIADALPWLTGVHAATSHGPNSWDTGETLTLDRPAPSVSTGSDSAAWYRHEVDRIVTRRIAGDKRTTNFREHEHSVDEPAPAIMAHGIGGGGTHQVFLLDEAGEVVSVPVAPTEAELAEASFEGYAIEAEWERLEQGEVSDKYLNLVRAHEDQPSPTVTQTGGQVGAASVAHPTEPRKFTIPELRRLCGFPDDFVLTGSYRQQWERLGRAVPPPMMRAVAERVARVLEDV